MSGLDGIDTAGVTAAIQDAGGVADSNVRDSVHEQPAPTPTTEAANQINRDENGRFAPPTQQTDAPVTNDPEPFSNVNPNDLPPELQQIYRSLQADYTRKTQQVADQRRLYEQFGDPQGVAEALQLQQQIADPRFWPSLHQQLSDGLREMGYSPAEASQIAAQEVQNQAQQSGSPLDALDDPDLQPVREAYTQLQGEVQQLRNELQSQRETEQAQALEMAVMGELQRQENFITQQNPHYTGDDLDAIYELSTYYDGNLIQAQDRYERAISHRLGQYLSSKSGPGVATGGVSGQTIQPPAEKPRTLDDAHDAAMQALRMLGEA